ncbi:amidase signature domain-containing protein [Mrakia frigida]|uniref:amidase signature domain-containing protein n=1 Tax=Mrakia frigida TaxID=29902 RepID=UPI003FCBF595
MSTTAGSYALLGMPVPRDAAVSAKLRAAGAIIIGKASLSEFANWKGNITNGWSARGGQTQSAYVIGGFAAGGDPCGSSSGSGVGVSAGFAAAALGSETDGSIICPSSRAALFGIKPTVGLTIAGVDERGNATTYAGPYIQKNYTQFTLPQYTNLSLFGFGIPRKVFFPDDEDALHNSTILDLSSKFGVFVQDPADFPSAEEFFAGDSETVVLSMDFRVDLQTYLEGLGNATDGGPASTIIMLLSRCLKESAVRRETNILSVMTMGKSSAEYLQARATTFRLGATEGIDAVLDKYQLDALLLPAEDGATGPAAVVGYPIGTVPLGYDSASGQPFGLAVLVRKWDEKTLISIMAGLEAALPPRKVPSQLV